MNKAALQPEPGQDAMTGKFLPGNRMSPGRPASREASVDEMRHDIAREWGTRGGSKILKALYDKSPVEYAKLMVSIIPKKDDSVITRVVNMQFNTVESVPDTPDEIHEDTPGDDTSAGV